MNRPPSETTDDSSSSPFSPSILRPSVLHDRPKAADSELGRPTFEPLSKLGKPIVDLPKFTPTCPISTTAEPVNTPGYVFGQNMSSRVVNANQGASEKIWLAVKSDNKDDENSSDGSVFTALAKAVVNHSAENKGGLLEDSAVALVLKRNAAQISLPCAVGGEQHEIITGEEDERTVLELTCNAYVFDRDSKQWKGIGQSYLHLNDTTGTECTTSRLIIRLQSTRRVVVNTRIWSEMPVAHAAENKAVRIGALTATGNDQADTEGTIRTYMLRFTSAESARNLFEALQKRRLSAEKLDTCVKRPRLENSQNSTNALGVTPAKMSSSDVSNDCSREENSISIQQKRVTTPNEGNVKKSAMPAAISFPCRQVRVYTASGVMIDEIESEDGNGEVVVNITDFPQSGTSILEVSVSRRETESLLTAAVGSRLAFCRLGGSEVHIFCTTEVSDDGAENGDVNNVARLDKSCSLLLSSASDAERLYRSILLRVVRFFMETSGIIKEHEGK